MDQEYRQSNPGLKMEKHPVFLSGGGEMGELIRSIDWSETPLGTPDSWPLALKQTVSMMLNTPFPVLVCWGQDYIQLYNDAFRPINGVSKHPQAMGGRSEDTYAEIWDTIGPMFKEVMNGQAVMLPDFMVPLERNGFPEECFFNFSYSPIRDLDGVISGVLVICMEVSENVQARKSLEIQSKEFQTLNEDLAASVEEYAATNEELAAVNDELASVNEELSVTIDELSETQASLQRSEKLFKTIAQNIPNSVIIMIDKNHRYITVEGDLMVKLGYDGQDYAGKHPTEVAPPEQYEAARDLYERVMAGERFSVERQSVTGEFYMVHFMPLRNADEEIDAGLIIALDITDIKQAEVESAKLAAIIESSEDAIISKNLESQITSWNDSAEKMFGYTASEILGESIHRIIPEDLRAEELQIVERIRKGERVRPFESKRISKTNSLMDVAVTISPIKNTSGEVIGLSKIVRDITEKKLIEQRKNDFVAIVSHELKTPLTTINSYVQILLAKARQEGSEFQINALSRTQVQARKMTSMIHDFLTLARLEEGRVPLHPSIFEFRSLAEEIAADLQVLTTKHKIVLHECEDLYLNADRDKIGQVLNNLLSNAIKYSPEGGQITIECSKVDDRARISVTDEGVGISADDQNRLFERFYRANNEKLRTVSGFGIGLFLVSEVLKFHNSKIDLKSEEHKGSTFSFSLDLHEE